MNNDKVLIALVDKQTDLFNRDASTAEKVKVYQQIETYKEIMRKEGK